MHRLTNGIPPAEVHTHPGSVNSAAARGLASEQKNAVLRRGPLAAATKIHGNRGELILTRCFEARPVGSAKALRSFVPEQNHRPTAATKIHGNHGELILARCFGARPVGSAEALRSFVPEQNQRPHDLRGAV